PFFTLSRSSSFSSLTGEDSKAGSKTKDPKKCPPLEETNQESKKRTHHSPDPPSDNKDKKLKVTSFRPDPELSEGFNCMVEKLLTQYPELSMTASDICTLLAKLKNSRKHKEIVYQSGLPSGDVIFIFQRILACPDTSKNMKSRIHRILQSLFSMF
ncbi:hypothetical protein WDU94_006584, partial [Cyamophila willieti]